MQKQTVTAKLFKKEIAEFSLWEGFSTPQHAIRACCVDLDECLHAHSSLIWQHAMVHTVDFLIWRIHR